MIPTYEESYDEKKIAHTCMQGSENAISNINNE